MMMRRRFGSSLLWVFSGAMLAGGAAPQAEEVSLATYYASPRGEYEELRVYDNALLAIEGGKVGIGTGGGAIRAMLDVHGEAAATVLGLAQDTSGRAQIWWLGSFSGDDFGWEQWDSMRGNYVSGTWPPELGATTHPSVLVTHADGNVGIGDFSLLPLSGGGTGPKSPSNRLDVAGSVAVGANYAAAVTAPSNGLLVEGKTSVSLSPGLQAKNELDVGGRAVIGSGYVGSATPPANSLLVEGRVGVGVPAGTMPANKLEVGGPAVIGAAYAGTVDVSAASGTFTANLGIQRESRTTKAIKAPNDGYPKAWMGLGDGWAFGILDTASTAGALTDGTASWLQVCAGDCLGGGASTNVFSASSDGIVAVTNSSGAIDTLELNTTTTPKLVGLKPGASLTIPAGAANNFVLTAEDPSGKAVWRATTTPGLQGNAGATPPQPTASRPRKVLLALGDGSAPCSAANSLVPLFEADNGTFFGCVGYAP